MHVYVNLQIGLRNVPKGRKGLTRANYKIDRGPATPIWQVAALMVRCLVNFCLDAPLEMSNEEVNEQIRRLAEYVGGCKVETEIIGAEARHD